MGSQRRIRSFAVALLCSTSAALASDRSAVDARKLPWFADWDAAFVPRTAKVAILRDGSVAQRVKTFYYAPQHPTPERRDVVLVHGIPGGAEVWHPLLFEQSSGRELRRTYDVFVVELPGAGCSEQMLDDVSFMGYARFLDAFLECIGAEDAVLVGHSYGGEIAFRAAARDAGYRQPSRDAKTRRTRCRVGGLVLIDCSGFRRRADELCDLDREADGVLGWAGTLLGAVPLLDRIPLAFTPGHGDTRAALESAWATKNLPEQRPAAEIVETYSLFGARNKDRLQVVLALTRESVGRDDGDEVRRQLRTLDQPLGIVWGEQDPWFTIRTQRDVLLEELRDRSALTMSFDPVSRAGHNPHEQQPLATSEQLLTFLGAMERRAAPSSTGPQRRRPSGSR